MFKAKNYRKFCSKFSNIFPSRTFSMASTVTIFATLLKGGTRSLFNRFVVKSLHRCGAIDTLKHWPMKQDKLSVKQNVTMKAFISRKLRHSKDKMFALDFQRTPVHELN